MFIQNRRIHLTARFIVQFNEICSSSITARCVRERDSIEVDDYMLKELNWRLSDISFDALQVIMPEPDMVLQYMGMPVDDRERVSSIVEGIKGSIEFLQTQEIDASAACSLLQIKHEAPDSVVFSSGEKYLDKEGFFRGAGGAVLVLVTLGDIAERLWTMPEVDPFLMLANDAVIGAATEVLLGRLVKEITRICSELNISTGYFLSPGCAVLPLDLQTMIAKEVPGDIVTVEDNVIKPRSTLTGILPIGDLQMQKGDAKISCIVCSRAQECVDKRLEFW